MTEPYRSENVRLAFLSGVRPDEAEALIGKTVAAIEGAEYGFTLRFTDGSSVKCSGHTWEDCGIEVEIEIADQVSRDDHAEV